MSQSSRKHAGSQFLPLQSFLQDIVARCRERTKIKLQYFAKHSSFEQPQMCSGLPLRPKYILMQRDEAIRYLSEARVASRKGGCFVKGPFPHLIGKQLCCASLRKSQPHLLSKGQWWLFPPHYMTPHHQSTRSYRTSIRAFLLMLVGIGQG